MKKFELILISFTLILLCHPIDGFGRTKTSPLFEDEERLKKRRDEILQDSRSQDWISRLSLVMGDVEDEDSDEVSLNNEKVPKGWITVRSPFYFFI